MTKEELQKKVGALFDNFIERAEINGEIVAHSNDVPYGNTYVDAGGYFDDSDIDKLKDSFIEDLEDDDYEAVKEFLEDEDMEITKENIDAVMEAAKEV